MVNAWTIDDCPRESAPRILRYIEKGLQTFAARDGGEGWADELRQMDKYVREMSE